MKVLVTGGAGFVGSVAVELLQTHGYDVSVLDNLDKGHAEAVHHEVPFHKVDLRDADSVGSVMATERPDAVMHFAALSIVPDSVDDPGRYYETNTAGSLNLLRSMVQNDVSKIVFSSTAAVYGKPANESVQETDALVPISPYGWSKLMVEQMLPDFERAYGMRYACLRFFNVSGATAVHGEDHDPETHLVPSAIRAALGLRQPLTVFGRDYDTHDGTAVRDYVHVVDLIEAHMASLNRLDKSIGAVNLGGGVGVSVAEILRAVETVSGRPVPHCDGNRRQADPPTLVADISKAAQVLDWTPRLSSIDTIVESSWSWMSAYQSGYASQKST